MMMMMMIMMMMIMMMMMLVMMMMMMRMRMRRMIIMMIMMMMMMMMKMMMMKMMMMMTVLKGASCSDFRHFSSCHQLESNPSSAHTTDYPNATGVTSIINCLSLYSLVTYLTICVYLC